MVAIAPCIMIIYYINWYILVHYRLCTLRKILMIWSPAESRNANVFLSKRLKYDSTQRVLYKIVFNDSLHTDYRLETTIVRPMNFGSTRSLKFYLC